MAENIQQAPHSMPLLIRYPDSAYVQKWWLNSIKEELSSCATQIDFFEKFAMRQFSNRGLAEGANEILKGLRFQARYYQKSLQLGDYPNG